MTWQRARMSTRLFARLAVVLVIVATGVTTVVGCSSSRTVRRGSPLAAAARKDPTGSVLTLSPASASPIVFVDGDSSGNALLDLVGDVARSGGAQLLEKKLHKIRVKDLNGRYAKTATTGIQDVFKVVDKNAANVNFELTIESAAIVTSAGASDAQAEMVVSARAVSRKGRRVLWPCEEMVRRNVSTLIPAPRGTGGLYNMAMVAALSDTEIKTVFNALADEAGRIVGRRVVNDSAECRVCARSRCGCCWAASRTPVAPLPLRPESR